MNTKQVKKRIKTAKNITKITKAMELVAASKMKQSQNAVESSRAYCREINRQTFSLSAKTGPVHPFLKTPAGGKRRIFLLIAPEKGLCGSLVSVLLKCLLDASQGQPAYGVAIGKKAREICLKAKLEILAEFPLGFSLPQYEQVIPIARLLSEQIISGRAGSVTAVYAEFINAMTQKPVSQTILPLKTGLSVEGEVTAPDQPYLFEPSAKKMIGLLLPHYLETQLYQLLLESFASEQSARMVAMKNATDNAEGIIDDLTLKYNKVRQMKITSEILDIATASEALENE